MPSAAAVEETTDTTVAAAVPPYTKIKTARDNAEQVLEVLRDELRSATLRLNNLRKLPASRTVTSTDRDAIVAQALSVTDEMSACQKKIVALRNAIVAQERELGGLQADFDRIDGQRLTLLGIVARSTKHIPLLRKNIEDTQERHRKELRHAEESLHLAQLDGQRALSQLHEICGSENATSA